jgi:secreted trypsin-like serine protease
MKKIAILAAATWLASSPAHAIVGGGTPQADGIVRSIVTIVGSRGNFCTGTLIAPTVVLTAAHCVQPGAVYKLAETNSDGKPQLADSRAIAIHPAFSVQAIAAHRATADVALLQLQNPPKGKSPAALASPLTIVAAGTRLTIAGIGVTVPGSGKSAGTLRVASLAVTGRPGTLQIRLADPSTNGTREGIGRLHRRFRRAGHPGRA